MATYSSSPPSQPESLLILPEHHVKPPLAVAGDKTRPNNGDCPGPYGCAAIILLIILLPAIPLTVVTLQGLRPYAPRADVVSAFVSVRNGTTSDRLTANWAVTLRLDSSQAYPHRVVALVFHDSGKSDGAAGAQRLLASTRRFSGIKILDPQRDDGIVTFAIQLRAEEADVGEHVVDSISKDLMAGNRLRFRVVVLVWVRLELEFNGDRYYLARISCDPFWIESSSIAGRESNRKEKCRVQVVLQSKSSSLEENWTQHIV
ncbi:unnamed protein product [Linum tenue]|uniref:Late embryogenesis abundant protein LEA-2 subgroup domain-containing protein n=1 Tax=Linum tenue TaxID=586396 RepID=A0AAV0HUW0_9ROSI|nr:unnamed protein product [Linum tenue]